MGVKQKLPGISTVEIIIVLAISTTMVAVAIGFFGTRTRTAQDDAARLVVANIAKVRNEAQQGLGASTDAGRVLLEGNELFGQAIEFNANEMIVYKLMQKPGNIVTAYESYSIPLTQQLQWWIAPGAGSSYCSQFSSCYSQPSDEGDMHRLGLSPISLLSDERLLTVFKNNSGQSYVFAIKGRSGGLGGNQFLGTTANKVANYTPDRQGLLRLAYGVPAGGVDPPGEVQFTNAVVQYFVTFDLSIPNNQSFEVAR